MGERRGWRGVRAPRRAGGEATGDAATAGAGAAAARTVAARGSATSTGRTAAWAAALLVALGSTSAARALCPDPFGDVTGDGKVSVADAICSLLAALHGVDPPPACAATAASADVNCDGVVTVADTLLVVGAALGAPLDPLVDTSGSGCPDACDCVPCGSGCGQSVAGSAEFVSGALDPAVWSQCVGSAPTASGSSGVYTITNSPFASTPSQPSHSWIYDLALDRGNQLCTPFVPGVEDFYVRFDLGWDSTVPELTHGGVALTDAQHYILARGYFSDGWSLGYGPPSAQIRSPSGLLSWTDAVSPSGMREVEIERVDGVITISMNGVPVLSGELQGTIAHIAIHYVRHYANSGGSTYPFGILSIGDLQWCY